METGIEVKGYVAYTGKVFSSEGLLDTWAEAETGDNGKFKLSGGLRKGKFNFAKRPKPGSVYRVIYADEDRTRFYAGGEKEPQIAGWLPDSSRYIQSDEVAKLESERIKAETPRFGDMKLSDLAEVMKSSDRKRRLLILALVMEYLGVK